jgi:hypothetical protein
MKLFRQGVGPLIVGLAAWCAAGTLAVSSADSASARIAVLGPWWVLPLAFVLAWAVRPFRETPWTAAPAFVSVIPWLPLPMLPVFLIFAGHMAWVPIALAVACAAGLGPLSFLAKKLNLFEPDDATVAALVLALALGGCAAWAADPRTPGGDEPSYLIITASLLKDGDLDLDNNHKQKDYASFYGGELPPDYRQRGLHGEIYSIHAPGVSVLVAPLFQFFGYTGARVMIVLLTAIGAMLTWRLSWRVTDSPHAAWFAWAAVVLTPTFAMQSFMVFPDGPGLLAVAAGTLMIVQLSRGDAPGLLPVSLTGIALAALPWLHTRFAALAAGLGAVIALRLFLADAPAKWRASRLAALLAIPVVSALLWFYFFKVLYGTFDPRAPYANEPQDLAWVIPAILAIFFDGQFGIAAYAPAVAASFAGFFMKPLVTSRRVVAEIGAIALVYVFAVTTVWMWWAGVPATPARFLAPILPMLAVPLAVLWTRSAAATRALLSGLTAGGAVIVAALLLVERAGYMWNYRNDPSAWLEWLSPVANLSRVLPGFFWDIPKYPFHAAVAVGVAAGLWLLVKSRPLQPRAAATLWAVAVLIILPPISWAMTGARALDPSASQLDVVAGAGAGNTVIEIGPARASRTRALAGKVIVQPPEPGVKNWAEQWTWQNVPAGSYSLRVRSTARFPATVRVLIARSNAAWREFTVPGAGDFVFPFLIPSRVGSISIDAGASKAALKVSLAVDGAVKDPGVAVRSAAQYPAAGVLFLDDMVFAEPTGFWVRGKDAAQFVVVADPARASDPIRMLVRNGASPNQVSVESGTYQKLLVMTPGQELNLEIPAASGQSATIRVASGDGFVPAEKNPESADRRLLGVWIEIK